MRESWISTLFMLFSFTKYPLCDQNWQNSNFFKICLIFDGSHTLTLGIFFREIYNFSILLTCSLNMYWNLRKLLPIKKTSVQVVQNHTVCYVVSPTILKKIRFHSPGEKNHETSLSKVKSLNEQNFFNNKWKKFVK